MSDFATPGADAFLAGDPLPDPLYIQMHLGNPGTNGTANVAAETDRLAVSPWTAPGSGGAGFRAISNTALEELLNSSNTEDVTHVTYWDSPTGGVCWFVNALGSTMNVVAGNNVTADVGDLVIKIPVWT